MPQDGSNNYQYPPGTPGITDQSIESESYNTFLDDLVVNDLNIARPIHRGGTGAVNAHDARGNLQTEVSGAQVTNYDSHVWEAGSFWSQPGATSAPTTTSIYHGVCTVDTSGNVTLIVRDPGPGDTRSWARRKFGGSWTPWIVEGSDQFVNVTGDTMTGPLLVTVKGSQFGSVGGAGAGTIVAQADANIKFYDFGPTNWSGMGVDPGGTFWLKTGGVVAPALFVDASQHTHLKGNLFIDKPTPTVVLNGVGGSNSPTLQLNRFDTSGFNIILCTTNNSPNWQISAPNSAGQFAVGRYLGGTYQNDPFVIETSGTATFNNDIAAKGNVVVNGGVTISSANPLIALQGPGTRSINSFIGPNTQWQLSMGTNVTNEFTIGLYNDSGGYLFDPLLIERGSGQIVVTHAGSGARPMGANLRLAISTFSPGISIRPNADTCWVQEFENAAGGAVGIISITATNTAYATASDMALKEDLKSFDAGHIVDNTNVYDFKWKSTGLRDYGIIAQQANEVYPAAVIRENEEMRKETGREGWFIDYSKYVPVIMQELKALRARVAELEGK